MGLHLPFHALPPIPRLPRHRKALRRRGSRQRNLPQSCGGNTGRNPRGPRQSGRNPLPRSSPLQPGKDGQSDADAGPDGTHPPVGRNGHPEGRHRDLLLHPEKLGRTRGPFLRRDIGKHCFRPDVRLGSLRVRRSGRLVPSGQGGHQGGQGKIRAR